MNELKLREQRLKAQALLELMSKDKSGTYSEADIEKQRIILQEISNYQVPVKKVYQLKKKVYKLTPSEDQTLITLKAELRKIDLQKNSIANKMSLIKPDQNCKVLVDQIKALREDWLKKKDEIYYYMQHNHLPGDESADEGDELNGYILPDDPVELHKALLNARSYKSNLQKRKQATKTERMKLEYDRKLVIQTNLLIAIKDKLATL